MDPFCRHCHRTANAPASNKLGHNVINNIIFKLTGSRVNVAHSIKWKGWNHKRSVFDNGLLASSLRPRMKYLQLWPVENLECLKWTNTILFRKLRKFVRIALACSTAYASKNVQFNLFVVAKRLFLFVPLYSTSKLLQNANILVRWPNAITIRGEHLFFNCVKVCHLFLKYACNMFRYPNDFIK